MTMSGPPFESPQHLRISVVLAGEEFDLEVPANDPMDAWLPDLVEILREHGVLAESQRADRWFRAGGVPLATDSSLRSQGVTAGQYLWLGSPPEPRVRLLPDGYSVGRRPMTVDEWSHRTLALRGRGAIALALALGVHVATLIAPLYSPTVAISMTLLAVQVGAFFALALSARLAELVSWQDWEIFSGVTFVSAILVGFHLGAVAPIPGYLAAAILCSAIALAALIVGLSRRWQSVFVLGLCSIVIPCAALYQLGVLQPRQSLGIAMAAAVVLAAASHRVSLILATPRRRDQQGERTLTEQSQSSEAEKMPTGNAATQRSAIATALDRYVTRPGRVVTRARFTQSAVATAALAAVAIAIFVNGHGVIETWYDIACLLALACFAFTAVYRSSTLGVAIALGLVAVVIGTSGLPAIALVAASVMGTVLAVAFTLDGVVGPTRHSAIAAVLIRVRPLLIIAVFALLAADLSGWQLAWHAGSQLGSVVFP
jgi:hypothetical protein